MTTERLDLVVFGASSFVGRLLCRYLLQAFGCRGELRWALAGRSQARLGEVRDELGLHAQELPILQADAADAAALRGLCAAARVVVSTVGPYALHGEPLVQACAETGTDYCDLTGEVPWIRRMLQRHEALAQASGARIVHCCGFDSLPSDLGVHHLQGLAMRRFGVPCTRVKMRVSRLRGGVSGGTVASLLNVLKEAAADPALRRELADPYSLWPADAPRGVRQPQVLGPEFDPDFDAWIAPFVMAAVNTRVVQRSNLLSGMAYGADFAYDEATLTGPGLKGRAAAAALSAGLGGFVLAGALPPTRALLERLVLPRPGQGPSPEAQQQGSFELLFHGSTAGGRAVRTRVTGDRDPGYGSTAKMLGQAAACLALDVPKGEPGGGFWTPATIFGDRLVERLTAYAGLGFEPLPDMGLNPTR